MIRKFKKGTVLMGYDSVALMDEGNIDGLYEEMTNSDLYIQFHEDIPYLVDYNKSLLYSLEWTRHFSISQNILDCLHGAIRHENNKLRLYPITDKEEIKTVFNHIMEEN